MAKGPALTPPVVLETSLPDYRLTMDPAGFQGLVTNYGLPLVHWRAMRCPVGITDPNDIRRGHEHHAHCSNGFIYKKQGTVVAVPTSNSTDPRLIDIGFVTGSAMQVTFDLLYKDTDKKVYVLPYDRFYIDDPVTSEPMLVATWELAKANDFRSDRLRYEAVRVEHVMDSNGVEYDNSDFDVVGGKIQWRANRGPQPGAVYTVWYQYRPHWYCKTLVHELRIYPVSDFMDSKKIYLKRGNFAAVLQRENFFRSEENDPDAGESPRQQPPPDSGFGDR